MKQVCCEDPNNCVEDVCPTDVDAQSLPPGIKTEAVLMMLGNISNALNEMVNGINSTITQIVTEGSQMEQTEGENTNDEQDS
jgi:hypothetical protein